MRAYHTTTVYGGHHRVSLYVGCLVNPQMLWYTILVNAWMPVWLTFMQVNSP